MPIRIIYPLAFGTHLAGIDADEFRTRFRDETGTEPTAVTLEKRHEETTVGRAEFWSVVVSGCLS